MSLQREINRIEQIARTAQIACAGLEGAEEKAFNSLHPRGPDGRFGGSSKLAAPVVAKTFRSDEIDDVGRGYKSFLAEFGSSLEISSLLINNLPRRLSKTQASFQASLGRANKLTPIKRVASYADAGAKYLSDSAETLGTAVSALTKPVFMGLVDALIAIEFTPIAVGHVIIGRDVETAIAEKVKSTLNSVAKFVEPVTKKGIDVFEESRELFDRAVTNQLAIDPDTEVLGKKAKAKAFDGAVAEFDKAMSNKSLFAPLVQEAAARLLIERLTKLGDRQTASERVADISLDGVAPGLRKEVTEIATDMHQLIGQDLHAKLIRQGAGFFRGRSFAIPPLGLVQIAGGSESDLRRVLFHELGHFTEDMDLDLFKETQDFVNKRAVEPLRPMAQDFPGCGYNPSEMYKPDHFISPYIGKSQQGMFTEVMSMGIEQFSNPETLRNFAVADREHLDLVLKHIRSQYEENRVVSKQQQLNHELRVRVQDLWRKEKAKNRSKAEFLQENKAVPNKRLSDLTNESPESLAHISLVQQVRTWTEIIPEIK